MTAIILLLLVSFVIMLAINTPVAVAIAVSSMLAILANGGNPGYVVAQRMANGIDSFPLLAIPFFVFSGYLMGRGGLARRLIDFAALMVGRLPGGLGYVNTLTCMLFGSISGSAAAAVSSIGGFMIPEMNRKGYDRDFNVALTASAATTGLLIPPSNAMIVYAVAAGSVSIAAMFMAGILPGILVGLCIMLASGLISVRKGYDRKARETTRDVNALLICWRAIPSLLLVVLILGGILTGIFTATEAAAVSVAYAFLLSVVFYREIPLRDLPGICLQSGLTTAVVMLLIGASSAMSWIMTVANLPQTVAAALIGLSDNPVVILLTINLLLLAVGTFMDLTPALLIFTPILLPVVRQLGVSDVHFGIIIIANLCIGLVTPPVGTCLFIGCGIGKTSIARVTVSALPFYLAIITALILITFVPWISLIIPQVCGLLK